MNRWCHSADKYYIRLDLVIYTQYICMETAKWHLDYCDYVIKKINQ